MKTISLARSLLLVVAVGTVSSNEVEAQSRESDSTATSRAVPTTPKSLSSVLVKLREQEALFEDYSATYRLTREFPQASPKPFSPSVTSQTTIIRQTVRGIRFHFQFEQFLNPSADGLAGKIGRDAYDGQRTVSVEEGSCVTVYSGRVLPNQMMPPHCWGMLEPELNVPLSIYLDGTAALAKHANVSNSPDDLERRFGFKRVESEFVKMDAVDGLDCVVVRVKRWEKANPEPIIDDLWLAVSHNLHVLRKRSVYGSGEVPFREVSVKKWCQLGNNIWAPDAVEWLDTSPFAKQQNRASSLTYRLQIDSLELHPRQSEDLFQLNNAPAELPKFEVDATGRLVGSPRHPTAVSQSPSTTLEKLLARLAAEEAKYHRCEMIAHRHYEQLSMPSTNRMAHEILERSVINREKIYFDDNTSSVNSPEDWVSHAIQMDDGTTRRSFRILASGDSIQQQYASIDQRRSTFFGRSEFVSCLAKVPRTIATDIKLRRLQGREVDLTAEYVGDESIDGFFCHKLKIDVKSEYYYYLWLARDRNLLPIRQEGHAPQYHSTFPACVSWAEDLREIRPGIWFPHRCVELALPTQGSETITRNRVALQWRRDSTVERFSLEPAVDDRLFSELTVPEGTGLHVIDENGKTVGQFISHSEWQLIPSIEQLKNLAESFTALSQGSPGAPIPLLLETSPAKSRQFRERGDSVVGRLLNQLEELIWSKNCYQEEWTKTLKGLVDLGKLAVPELIEELDTTTSPTMLRCLGFVFRAIDDKRPIPALIRAIPGTLREFPQTTEVSVQSADLLRFAKSNQVKDNGAENSFALQSPVIEIMAALRKLTGKNLNEKGVRNLSLGHQTTAGRREFRKLFYDLTDDYAKWWNDHGAKLVGEEVFAKIHLSPMELSPAMRRGAVVDTVSVKWMQILQPVEIPDSKFVFYDVERGHYASLPDKWRLSGEISAHYDEIVAWADGEGFDLMGTQYVPPNGNSVNALRGIGIKAWQIDPSRWKQRRMSVTLESLRKEGPPVAGLLLQRSGSSPSKISDPQATTSFLVITAQGTPTLLHVGVEVKEGRNNPPTFFFGDPELNPSGRFNGRRFTVMELDEADPTL